MTDSRFNPRRRLALRQGLAAGAMLAAPAIEGSANGTASVALGLGEITSPGLCKIFAANPSNATLLLDEILVAKDSPFKTLADLKDKRMGCGPCIQNVAGQGDPREERLCRRQTRRVAGRPARGRAGRRPARRGLHASTAFPMSSRAGSSSSS